MTCLIDKLVKESVSCLEAETSIQEAACFMADNNLGSVLVTESGKVIGLFTEHDLLARVIGRKQDPRSMTLGEACTRNLISISHDSSCESAIRLMRTNHCRRLLVYHKDSLHGLVGITEVAHAIAEHRGRKNTAVNLVGGITLTAVVMVIAMLIAILPRMLELANQAMG